MTLRTKGEQKAYLDGYEMCAECIEKYLSAENKKKLDCLLSTVRNAVEIENIESENKDEWIPVSERLPETHQDVLLELRSGEMLTGFKAETEPYFYCHGVDGCYVEPQNVLAWQPLPEPYKSEKGGE